MHIFDLIQQHRIIICCGPGGVGKTTLSAALAVLGAASGKQTLIMTIDPAKRLASALGLSSLTNQQAPVPEEPLRQAGCPPTAILHAMMLDAKRTWDELVAKYAPSPSIRDKIYNNSIYKSISDAMSGSQEYMALEKLHEMATVYSYDLIIVDTPPSANAIDFLKAPLRMTGFMSNSKFFQIFLSPGMRAGKLGWRVFSTGGAGVLKIFERLTGDGLIGDISEFFSNFEEMISGFGQRAQHIDELIHSKAAAFVLVLTPDRPALNEAQSFKQKLDSMGIALRGCLINRVTPEQAELTAPAAANDDNDAAAAPSDKPIVGYLTTIYGLLKRRRRRERQIIDQIHQLAGPETVFQEVPLIADEVNDLQAVALLSSYLKPPAAPSN